VKRPPPEALSVVRGPGLKAQRVKSWQKTRPVAVVSPDSINRFCASRPGEIAVDQIRTLNKERFMQCIGSLSEADARRLRATVAVSRGTW